MKILSIQTHDRRFPLGPGAGSDAIHLVLFNHIGLAHEAIFLETIPHLSEHFVEPVHVEAGVYRTPRQPGSSCRLV